jgi:hypothetical protein
MSSVNLRALIVYALILYILGGTIYFAYHAFKIVRATTGIKERIRFFFTMFNNPLWRIYARDVLSHQTPELKAYMLRIEIQRYLFFALGILMFVSAVTLMRMGVL